MVMNAPSAGQTQFVFRQHWIRLVKRGIWNIIWTAVILVTGYGTLLVGEPESATRHILLSLLILTFMGSQLKFLMNIFNYFLYVIIVTESKVHRIKKTLVTFDDHETIDTRMLQDIHKSQTGVLQNILGFGTLHLDAQNTQMRIHFTPKVERKYRFLTELREKVQASSPPERPLPKHDEKELQLQYASAASF